MSRNLRAEMPQIAAMIDQLRREQGVEVTNAWLRRATTNEPGLFWASENGFEVGIRDTSSTSAYFLNERGISERTEPDWMIDATRFANLRGIEIEIKDFNNHEEARERAKLLRKILREAKCNA
ncbi:hypothetical protein ACO0K0_02495 [Undibacterium sp. SXout11W]|uniref:hypothetical protein n=1 Tax=Undibacterium sp. SXout11W TaxID=3413050 RepID=UPI003BF38B79